MLLCSSSLSTIETHKNFILRILFRLQWALEKRFFIVFPFFFLRSHGKNIKEFAALLFVRAHSYLFGINGNFVCGNSGGEREMRAANTSSARHRNCRGWNKLDEAERDRKRKMRGKIIFSECLFWPKERKRIVDCEFFKFPSTRSWPESCGIEQQPQMSRISPVKFSWKMTSTLKKSKEDPKTRTCHNSAHVWRGHDDSWIFNVDHFNRSCSTRERIFPRLIH